MAESACRMLDAAARLRENQEDDTFNICRLTTFFATQVASNEQILRLIVEAYPHSLNIMVSAPPQVSQPAGLTAAVSSWSLSPTRQVGGAAIR